jgi:peptidoglycan/LPS O-acetylase OafA/YrhL
MTAAPQSREFFNALESLRGIAALGVVFGHINWTFPLSDVGLIRNSYLMVDLFFVLSGFVICHSYGERIETGRDVARFIWVRFGRLYPLHLTFLFVFLAIEIAKYIADVKFGFAVNSNAFTSNNTFSFISNLLLIQALGVHDHTTSYNASAWSISTEFYTYVIFATILLLFKARVAMVSASGLLIIASITLDSGRLDHNIFRCIEGFFVGVITYHCYEELSTRQFLKSECKWWMDAPGILSLIGLIIFLSMKDRSGVDTLILPLVAVLILSIALTPRGLLSTILDVAPLAWTGKVSYSIYMAHLAVIWPFSQVLRLGLKTPRGIDGNGVMLTPHPLTGFLFLAAAFACILFVSHLTYTYIEDPYRKKSKKLAEKWFSAPTANCAERTEPGIHTDLSGYSTAETLSLDQRRL